MRRWCWLERWGLAAVEDAERAFRAQRTSPYRLGYRMEMSGPASLPHHANVCEYFSETDRPVESGARGIRLASRSVSRPSL